MDGASFCYAQEYYGGGQSTFVSPPSRIVATSCCDDHAPSLYGTTFCCCFLYSSVFSPGLMFEGVRTLALLAVRDVWHTARDMEHSNAYCTVWYNV